MDEAADFYAKQMKANGFEVKRIPFDRDSKKLLNFMIVQGKEPWTAYNSKQLISADKVRKECLPVLYAAGLNPDHETIVVFTAIMEWDDKLLRFRQQSPYFGMGNAHSGFCWQFDAPPLDPKNLLLKTPNIDDGEFGIISAGRWNSLMIGGVIHELGHSLGLPHDAERPAELQKTGTSLMGLGNLRYAFERRKEGLGAFLTFPDALRLASHPFFTRSAKGLAENDRSSGVFEELACENDGDGIIVSGRVNSSPATYAVIAYTDGEGRSDYDAITTSAIPNAEGRFQVRCDTLPHGKQIALRLTGLQVNGLTYMQSGLNFVMTPAGKMQTEELKQTIVLLPILNQLRAGRADEAARLTAALPDTEPAKQLAAPMLTPPNMRPLTAEGNSVSLCDLRPSSATVGWRTPAFDYSPEDLTIRVAGKLERRGIYAHPPSTYSWTLDGTWKNFHAICTVRDEETGSVVFVVTVDNVEKWRSDLINFDTRKECDVDLTGATSLKLTVEDGGDGSFQDHGFWIAPVLTR